MKRKLRLVSVFFCLLILDAASGQLYAAPANDRPATLKDFAGRLTVAATPGELMFLELPLNVYQHVERADLGDIRMFDSAGMPIPFTLQKPEQITMRPEPRDVPFFVWQSTDANRPPSRTDIQIDAAQAVVKVQNHMAGPGKPVDTFLLDLSEMPFAASQLKLEFVDRSGQFNSTVRLQHSNDLDHWLTDNTRQTVARYGGTDKTTIDLPATGAKYLLLALDENAPPLKSVQAVFSNIRVPGQIKTSVFEGGKSEDGLSINYATGAFLPMVALDFVLPQADSMPIKLYSRFDESRNWSYVDDYNLYRFNPDANNTVRRNQPLAISSHLPYGLITSELPFANPPQMIVHWQPYQLIFLARGAGPWVLAYGNQDYAPVFDRYLRETAGQQPLAAQITGEETYQPRAVSKVEPPANYQQWLLWGVLMLAVIILSVLAFYMARSMKKPAE